MNSEIRMLSNEGVSELEEILGYEFQRRDLLIHALTHSSCLTVLDESNERLEFLGDAVLGMVVSELLFEQYPEFTEGVMTKTRSAVVSRKNLARLGLAMKLEQYVIVGRMFATPEAISHSVLSNAVEAIIAAIYQDSGIEAVREFVVRHLSGAIERAAASPGKKDFKSLLVQWAQKERGQTPRYRLMSAAGPDHTKTFEVVVELEGFSLPAAWGLSKKQAEQRAARLALVELGLLT